MKNKYSLNRWIKAKANFLKAVNYLGGKCCHCGESHIAVLDFHHREPQEKEFTVAILLRSYDWDSIYLELDKCELLCSNCHRKHHFNDELYREHEDEIKKRAEGWRRCREVSLKKWSDTETELLIKLYNAGNSLEAISSIIGRTPRIVKTNFNKLVLDKIIEVHETKRKSPKFADPQQILALWDTGKNAVSISQTLEISLGQVYRVLRKERK